MGQTFQRVNKSRRDREEADLRRDLNSKQSKNLSKHRNSVYDLVDSDDDDFVDHYDNEWNSDQD